jgi:hypothetical protein
MIKRSWQKFEDFLVWCVRVLEKSLVSIKKQK